MARPENLNRGNRQGLEDMPIDQIPNRWNYLMFRGSRGLKEKVLGRIDNALEQLQVARQTGDVTPGDWRKQSKYLRWMQHRLHWDLSTGGCIDSSRTLTEMR